MRVVHISDLHFWHITLNPRQLLGKRLLGMSNLFLNRAWNFRMESMPALVDRIQGISPDHLLITGDLTSTALEEEFRAARRALIPLNPSAPFLSVVPGNHDRYTRESARSRLFEKYFGEFAPAPVYPWLKRLGEDVGILASDPTHPNPISAPGTMTTEQILKATELLHAAKPRPERLIVACHYPIALPAGIVEGRGHGLRGARELQAFLARESPALYCHGHIHASWAFSPQSLPRTLCLDPGAALKIRNHSGIRATMLEIILAGKGVEIRRHALRERVWNENLMLKNKDFFDRGAPLNAN